MTIRALAGLAACLAGAGALSSCATISSSTAVDERVEKLSAGLELRLPENADGPAPAILLFHGCGGLYMEDGSRKAVMDEYAAVANERGVAVVIVDSFTPRGIDYQTALRQVCSGLRLRGRDRAHDVEAALAFAREQPEIDASRLALAGWSHGGWTVMESLIMFGDEDGDAKVEAVSDEASVLAGVNSVYLTYPYCGFLTRAHERAWGGGLKIRVILAGDDTLSKNERCRSAVKEARSVGADVSVHVFDGMTHAFDEAEHHEDSTFVYDEAASARAHELFGEWLETAAFPDPAAMAFRVE
ncbi:MAG: dienelactone hydrolase family protein [Caulobacterales bacterium]|nr:dienelactone hydrolase family protein [Caulobacterales bacterium]